MKRKGKTIIFSIIFFALIIFIFVAINVYLSYPDHQDIVPNQIDEVIYIGDDNPSLANAFSDRNIRMKYYTQINEGVVNTIVIVDSQYAKIDYSHIKKLLGNNILIFIDVTNTERIQKEIFNKDSYDILISENDHEKNLAMLRKNQYSEDVITIIGYYSYPDKLYNNFVENVIKYSQQ